MVEIYSLSDPRDGAVRYIGKAKCAKKRLQTHISDARLRKTPVYVWINELLALRLLPVVTVVEQCEASLWPARERALIADARARGERLLNLAPGGNQPHCPREVCIANGKKSQGWKGFHAAAANDIVKRNTYRLKILMPSLLRTFAKIGDEEGLERVKAKMRFMGWRFPVHFSKWMAIE